MDLINCSNYSETYDTGNLIHEWVPYFSEENKTKNNISYELYSRPTDYINIQLLDQVNAALTYGPIANTPPLDHIIILKFNYDLI